jgi:hypothetical protein
MAEIAAGQLNATDAELAALFGVHRRTIEKWKQKKEFSESLRRGKNAADQRVVKALYERATGYNYKEKKVTTSPYGEQEITEFERHAPPDVTAALKWLFNRQPGTWRASPVETDDDTPEPKQIIIMTKDCRLPATDEPDTVATEGIGQNI